MSLPITENCWAQNMEVISKQREKKLKYSQILLRSNEAG